MISLCSVKNCEAYLWLRVSCSVIPPRYRVTVEVPVQKALFRVLPPRLQQGQEIVVFVVLFTQGINEQQTLADK